MPKTLQEYADWLDHRSDLLWPKPPALSPVKAKAHVKPLRRVKAVIWDIYGTLLRITDGDLLLLHHKEIRMQVALEKTINEFNMWNSMTRRPGAPWEYLLQKYRGILEDVEMTSVQPGDFPQANSTRVWLRLLEMLDAKEYRYDKEFYGSFEELASKVAYFFQSCLQGIEASPNASRALREIAESGIPQGILADTQPFTLVQMLRALREQGDVPKLNQWFDPGLSVMSHQLNVRKPSESLFGSLLRKLSEKGVEPSNVLYVGNRIGNDLAVARQLGIKTALYAGDKLCFKASVQEINHPDIRPRRLLTDLAQVPKMVAPAD